MNYPATYLEGIRLFNTGSFWHAHEQWEICWRATQGLHAIFFKGIIQSAAALEKWQRGNLRGMQLNWAKSCARLEQLPALYMGLNLATFRQEMGHFVSVQSMGYPSAPPQIVLINVDTA